MGVPMDGSAATGAAITGTFADGSMTGKIALIRRGACYFTSKTINAQNAGAVAAVIYNDDRAGLVTMSGPDVGVTIPAIFIDGRVGDSINEAVAADPSLTFSLHCGTMLQNALGEAAGVLTLIPELLMTVFCAWQIMDAVKSAIWWLPARRCEGSRAHHRLPPPTARQSSRAAPPRPQWGATAAPSLRQRCSRRRH